jgi:hypothetical protein
MDHGVVEEPMSHVAIATLTSTPSSATPSSTTSSSSANTATSNPSSGLGSGAKIGIGVGIADVVSAISAFIFACVLMRKRRAQEDVTTGGPNEFYQPEVVYHEAPEPKLKPVVAPLSIHRTELPS